MAKKLLIDKLGIKEGFKIIILGPSENYDIVLKRLPENVIVMRQLKGPLDFILLFTKKKEELENNFPRLKKWSGKLV